MKIEIWSDVVCPFCYIGKRKLEKSLSKMPFQDEVEIEWKSFQLNPNQVTDPSKNTLEDLSQSKGWTLAKTKEITSQVVDMAKAEGLEFDFEKSVVANTKNAHKIIHLAKQAGRGPEMKERLLKAYFTDGLNVDDEETLVNLASEFDIPAKDVSEALNSEAFEQAVDGDIYESRQLGVQGVPFFVLDRKYGISGAQPDQVFDDSLRKAWEERG